MTWFGVLDIAIADDAGVSILL
jgi:hypothetical protein